MRSYSVAALAAIVANVLAAPAPVADSQVVPQGAFTIEQVAVGKKLKNGAEEIAKTYKKFNKTPPSNVVAAAAAVVAAVQSGSVSATPQQYDSAYLCPVSVGGQTLNLDFDTGSSDLWVFSSLTPSAQRSGHAYYTPGSSAVSEGKTWEIGYGDGSSSSGTVYADTVVVGGVTATSQAVEAATSVSTSFQSNTQLSGLLGLAFDSINTCSPSTCATFVDTVLPTLPSPLFAAYLKKGAVGAYDFGFVNSNHYTGKITTVNVNKSGGFWSFSAGGYEVGTTKYTSTFNAIVDTGTTLIYLPLATVKNYYAKVSGAENNADAGGYIFPCSATLPTFSVIIGGNIFTVPAAYMNYAPYTSSYCFGGLQSSAGVGINILGDIFIKSQYVIFTLNSEAGTSTLGFAAQK